MSWGTVLDPQCQKLLIMALTRGVDGEGSLPANLSGRAASCDPSVTEYVSADPDQRRILMNSLFPAIPF